MEKFHHRNIRKHETIAAVLPNTKLFVDPINAAKNTQLIEGTVGFITDTIVETRRNFRKHYKESTLPKEREIGLDELVDTPSAIPNFSLYDHRYSDAFLASSGLEGITIDGKSLMLVYNLPTLIEQWCRTQNAPGWMTNYRPIILAAWNTINHYSKEKTLQFDRLSKVKDHRPGEFHYIWKVSLPPRKAN